MSCNKTIIKKSYEYINSCRKTERNNLASELDDYDGNISGVICQLKYPVEPENKSGWIMERPFKKEKFKEKYNGEILTLYIPEDYNPQRETGLLIFLHGGGNNTVRNAPTYVPKVDYGIKDILENSDRIVCCPCCPFNEKSFNGWNLPESEEYLMDVIEDVEYSYNIDSDNMIMAGHSMGGIGVYHLSQRLPDRFASFFAHAGCWDFAYWPSLIGSSIWLHHGINDSVMFKRRHGTDIEFARLARKRLEESGVECVYRENSGGHDMQHARHDFADWIEWCNGKRRDPVYPHVVAATPRGSTPWPDWRRHKIPLAANQNYIDFHEISPSPHNRWVTVEKTGNDTIIYDMLEMSDCKDDCENDWNEFNLTLKRKHIKGGVVEAYLEKDNRIEVLAKNVEKLTLWLHPDMVDLNNICVIVNGIERFKGSVTPKLSVALDSYLRRRDWGLIYPARITLEADESWGTRDQLKLRI